MPIGTFGFEDLSSNDKALRTFTRAFGRLGANVVQTEVPQRIKRTAGISYKEVNLTFADSQTVTLCVKKTGDIFQVKLNGKALPIRNQDDQKKAVKEIVDAMDSGRAAFQRKLARTQVKVPTGIKTAAPRIEAVLTEKVTSLKDAIAEVNKRCDELRTEIANVEQQTQENDLQAQQMLNGLNADIAAFEKLRNAA